MEGSSGGRRRKNCGADHMHLDLLPLTRHSVVPEVPGDPPSDYRADWTLGLVSQPNDVMVSRSGVGEDGRDHSGIGGVTGSFDHLLGELLVIGGALGFWLVMEIWHGGGAD